MSHLSSEFRIAGRRGVSGLGIALLALLTGAMPALAQQGTVTGRVMDQATLRPLGAVQVFVQGQNIGILTDTEGRFRLEGVTPGEVTIRAQLIGYAAATSTVTVPPNGTVEVEFRLGTRAIDMDEIIVTGTGAPQQRRRLGQTINSISSQELEMSPVTSVADALQGRVPGLSGLPMGETGAASKLLLRGTASLSQRNEPLIYVDGVRMDNRRFDVGGVAQDRLSDINPADIDRIEVIKGAAAATLFGTEASSGVIQIFTKRGLAQAPVFTFQVDQHAIHLPHGKWPVQAGYNATTGQVVTDRPAEAWVDLGYHQSYSVAVRGGSPGVQYFVSGRFMDEDGPLPNHGATTASVRSSFDFNHTERLRSSVDLNVVRGSLQASWPSWSSVASDFLLANPANANERFTHGESEMPVGERLLIDDEAITRNIAVSAALNYDVREDILASFRVGYNDVSRKRTRFSAEGEVNNLPGVRQLTNTGSYATTLDASINWTTALTDRIQSNLTVGGQSFWEGVTTEFTGVSQFASPTLGTLRGASTITGVDEFTQDVINAGFFAQEQIGLDNRLFVTLGIRMDGNSAFGEDFGLTSYPKVGVSWVLSDHDFWNFGAVDEFRVRGAIGTSGLQPGAFDAQRTWQPGVFAGGISRITPLNLGNPELKPERSTEREIGIEAGLFGGRLGIDAVYFNQKTVDALLPQSAAPSTGFTTTQLRNIGEMTSQGLEAMLNFRVMDRRDFGWEFNASYTHIDQKVTDMGGIPDFRIEGRRRWSWIAEGHRPGVVLAPIQDPSNPYTITVPASELTGVSQVVPNMLRDADGEEALVNLGNSLPDWTVDFGSTFRFGQNLSVRALFTGAGGFIMSNETEVLRTVLGINEFAANIIATLANPNATEAEKLAAADAYGRKHPTVVSSFMEDGDWLKLNELSLTYDVPMELSGRFGLGRTVLLLGGRNLVRFTKYSGILDPGSSGGGFTGVSEFLQNVDYISAPTPRRYIFSIRTTR